MVKVVGLAVATILLAAFLRQVFFGRLILPQTFFLGPVVIHYYGLIMALAVGSGIYWAIKRAAEYGIDAKKAEDLLFWIAVFGFVGARLYHVLSSATYYWAHPVDIVKVWNGGLSIYGAVIAGIFVIAFFAKSQKLKALSLLDWLAPSLIAGQIIGRFGNLFNYEAFGYPTNLPWKMFVPPQFRPENYLNYNYFHPWFLYEVLGNIAILMVLLYMEKSFKSAGRFGSGLLFFFYLLLYNSLRFVLEFQRIDSTFVHGVRLNAASSLFLVILAAASLIYLRRLNVKAS